MFARGAPTRGYQVSDRIILRNQSYRLRSQTENPEGRTAATKYGETEINLASPKGPGKLQYRGFHVLDPPFSREALINKDFHAGY